MCGSGGQAIAVQETLRARGEEREGMGADDVRADGNRLKEAGTGEKGI